MLIGCSGKELNGNWRLADNDTTCPVSYQFDKKIEVNPENKKENYMVNRDAYSKIANEYKNAGTYTWLDNEWINIDYGNNFTQKQKWYKIKTN